jgi:hypothetical protein
VEKKTFKSAPEGKAGEESMTELMNIIKMHFE